MIGDRLARGAKQAGFGSMSHVSQEKWDAMWSAETPVAIKTIEKTKQVTKPIPEKALTGIEVLLG